jgi:hypothetical protein
MAVGALDKPSGQWCPHCTIAKGCGVSETRPQECRTFDCVWLHNPTLGEEWKPNRARFVLAYELGGKRLTVRCDPARPDAWKKQPYHAGLRALAKMGAPRGQYVMVDSGGRAIVVLPERDVDLGIVREDERIVTKLWGPNPDAIKVHESDPRARVLGGR